MTTLSLYDLTGIQDFTFGARRLRANLGASWLVHQALAQEGWLGELVAQQEGATVLWSGGGNAVVESPDEEKARAVATALSARLLSRSPGLDVVCAHQPWDGIDYIAADRLLRKSVAYSKASRGGAAHFDGGGVCEPCRDTAEPAVDWVGQPIGLSVEAREGARGEAHDRLTSLFDPSPRRWSEQIDELGRTSGEESAIGVVHIDGNGMGDRFRTAAAKGLERVKDLSRQVNDDGIETLRAGLTATQRWCNEKNLGFDLFQNADEVEVFPVRPVLFGGDDITLVCDGRIALDLAAEMLRAWHERSAFHACAGVALVRAHYPFYRAVTEADELCREAKKWRKDHMPDRDASLLSWSMFRSGGLPSHKPRRSACPYVVCGEAPRGKPWRSWEWFRKTCVKELQGKTELHTQIKGLASPLAAGPEAAKRALSRLLDRHDFRLPSPPGHQLDISGFEGDETPYLNALELLDFVPEKLP